MSNRQDTMARRDLKMAEDKIQRHLRVYRRARGALQHLKAPREVMDIYKPILANDLTISGDVVEEQRLGQRNDVLAWFWHIGAPQGDQGDDWMEECEHSSRIVFTIDSNEESEVYRVNWLWAKAWFDRWQEEVQLVMNEMKWTELWFDHHKDLWAKRAGYSMEQGLIGHSCYAWKQAGMWEAMARDAAEIFWGAMVVGSHT